MRSMACALRAESIANWVREILMRGEANQELQGEPKYNLF